MFYNDMINYELQQEYVLIKHLLTHWATIIMCLNNKIYKYTFKVY